MPIDPNETDLTLEIELDLPLDPQDVDRGGRVGGRTEPAVHIAAPGIRVQEAEHDGSA